MFSNTTSSFLPNLDGEDDTSPVRQVGLYATRNYVIGEKITPFFGHAYWSSSDVPEKGKNKAFQKSTTNFGPQWYELPGSTYMQIIMFMVLLTLIPKWKTRE